MFILLTTTREQYLLGSGEDLLTPESASIAGNMSSWDVDRELVAQFLLMHRKYW